MALKVYKKSALKDAEIHWIYQERAILAKLDHPNIIKIVHFYKDDDYIILVQALKDKDLRGWFNFFDKGIEEE